MKNIPIPTNELERIKALKRYSIMDSLPEDEYDSITKLASFICETPISLVSLLDEERQWFKSAVGLDAKETAREISFCQYAIMGDGVYEVSNALDDNNFSENPLVTGDPNIRFYAGAPIKDEEGFNLGTLCVIDTVPRTLSEQQKEALQLLSHQVVSLLKLRKNNTKLIETQKEFQNFISLSKDLVCIANVDGNYYKVNPAFTTVLGYSKEELEGQPFIKFVHPEDLDKTYKEVAKLSQGLTTISFENRSRCKDGRYVTLSWNTSPDPVTGNLYCIARDMTIENQQKQVLKQTTTDLTAILNSAEFSIIATDKEGNIKQFNKGAEKLLGYNAAEVIDKKYASDFHLQDEVEKRAKELSSELSENVIVGFDTLVIKVQKFDLADSHQWSYVKKDGTVFPIVLSVTAIKNDLGDITGYLGIAKDITKEKEAEQELIDSKILLDDSQRIAKIGSWKFNTKTNNLVWSKGHYEVFEFEETSGDKLNEAYRSRIHPEDLIKLDNLEKKIIKDGENFTINYRVVFPDGRIKHILEIGSPLLDTNGKTVGMQGNVQDVTEIKLAENKIKDKAKEINDVRAALDESAIVTITDQNGILTYVNDKFCSISQFSKEELLGQHHYIDASGNYTNILVKKIWLSIANGNIWKGELKQIAKDGSYYWVHTTIVPFLDKNGKPYQYIAISADITQEKIAEENLQSALLGLQKTNKELDQFAYVVSHDLKAPLRAINNLAEWIVEDMPEMPQDVSNNLNLLRGRILRMENLINGVLDYSRIGRTKIEKETIDLNLMISQIVETIVPIKGFEVTVSDMPEVFSAKILLYQVFSNIISNAVKYNDKPIGVINCTYESLPGFHQFTITDNGPGISKEYHKKVFGVFQTIEARDKKESTGIGLSIVQKIIEEKGGQIYIESEEDKGASFVFTLPKINK